MKKGAPLVLGLLLVTGGGALAQTITEFPVPTAASGPVGITAGPDGNLWFTEFSANKVGRITTAGVFTEFPLPVTPSAPVDVVAGPDGNLWFLENMGNRVGRITTAGVISGFTVPTPSSGLNQITAGPDGNLWFTEGLANKIGRITPAGVITEFPIPTGGSRPNGIAAGPDGNVWFTEGLGNRIGRITPFGVVTEFVIPTSGSVPAGIGAGPDGNLWFTEFTGNKIGRITTAGTITEFPLPAPSSAPNDIAAGPDGNLWFTVSVNKVGRITPAGVITELTTPTPASFPASVAAGPDGNVWFTEQTVNRIGRVNLRVPEPEPEPDTLRIIPVVGSTPGAGGSFFKTSFQLHNPANTPIEGLVTFHPSGIPGQSSDPQLSYLLAPRQTVSHDDLLPLLQRSGLGSADVRATSGSLPILSVRVFNDAGAAGTTGFTEPAMRPNEALVPGHEGVLILPADLVGFRFNLGIRTIEATAATFTVRSSGGSSVATVTRVLPATYHEQQAAAAFLGVTTLPPGGTISVVVNAGAAIFYGATVDNRTGDPSLQIAAPGP